MTKKQSPTRMDMAEKRKPQDRKWFSFDNSAEQHRKDYVKAK